MKKHLLSQIFRPAAASLLALLFLAALPVRADDNAPPFEGQMENRFLFIVDTASAMHRYSNAVVQCVSSLIESDMRGEFRDADTIGLWTYNDKFHPEFPMQVWSKANKEAIITDMTDYLRDRRYEDLGELDKVMPALNDVIKHSERITVILIFDGSGKIHGTPFDKDIATLQKKYARELRAARVPFVLILAARNGVVFDYTINYPGMIAIPHTAYAKVVPETNAPAAVVAPPVTQPPAQSRHISLILSGQTNVTHVAAPPPQQAAPPVAVVHVATPQPAIVPAAAAPVSRPTPTVAPPPVAVAPPTAAPVPAAPPPQAAPPAIVQTNNNQQPSPAPVVARNAAAASIAASGGTGTALFISAFLLLAIALVLAVFLIRRSRGVPQPSLISQSIDRPR